MIMKPPLPRPPRREADMSGPAWLTGIFAALMLTVAVYCAGRLVAARRWRRPTELDTDAGHVLMGLAMAGMLVATLRILPAAVWEAIFALAAAWFCAQLLRARRGASAGPWRCPHPTPHLVECAAMLYMFLALPTSLRTRTVAAMTGMTATPAGSRFSILALALALFMLAYAVQVADRLTLHAPATLYAPALAVPSPSQPLLPTSARSRAAGPLLVSAPPPTAAPLTAASPFTAADPSRDAPVAQVARAAASSRPGRLYLAPRCSALCKIAMGLTMGYMLILML
jgi:hypothetical protein